MDNLTDLNKYREMKQKKLEEEKQQKIEDEDTKLFIDLISKPPANLPPEQRDAYNEIGLLLQFQLAEKFSMGLAVFRNQIYVVNYIGNEMFEYIGKFQEIMEKGLGI